MNSHLTLFVAATLISGTTAESLLTWDGCVANEEASACRARFNARGDKIVAAEYGSRGARLLQTTATRAASLLGAVGATTVAGTDAYWPTISFPTSTTIAGPFEAGFDSAIDTLLGWMGCSPTSNGYLAGGIDTQTSMELVAFNCSITLPRINSAGDFVSLMWAAGAHSPPNTAGCTSPPGSLTGYAACSNPSYHFHQNFTNLYNYGTGATGHSTKIGVTTPSSTSITARNIYGKYESTQTLPTDLDSCLGHFGLTPESPSTKVYHHHVSDKTPFSVGCYGPSAAGGLVSITDCRSYYTGCTSSNVVTLRSAKGWFQYTKWCPCHDNVTNSNVYPSPATLYYSTYELMLAAAATAAGTSTSSSTTTTGSTSTVVSSSTTNTTTSSSTTASSSSTSSNDLAIGLGVGLGVGIPVVILGVLMYMGIIKVPGMAPKAGSKVASSAPPPAAPAVAAPPEAAEAAPPAAAAAV